MQISKEEVAYLRSLVAADEHGDPYPGVDKSDLYDRLHQTWWTALRQAVQDINSGIRYDNPDHNYLQEQIDYLKSVVKSLERAVRKLQC